MTFLNYQNIIFNRKKWFWHLFNFVISGSVLEMPLSTSKLNLEEKTGLWFRIWKCVFGIWDSVFRIWTDWLVIGVCLRYLCVFGVWITNVTAQDKPVLIGGQKWKQMLRLSWEGYSDLDMSFQEHEKIRQGPQDPNPVLQQVGENPIS